MAVRITPRAWTRWLDEFVRQAKSVRLFTDDAQAPAKFAEPAPASGYVPVTLTGARWEIVARGGIITAAYPELQMRWKDRQAVAGYFVTDASDAVLWWERFAFDEGQPPAVNIQFLELVVEIDIEG